MEQHQIVALETELAEWYSGLPIIGQIPSVPRALHAQLGIRYTYAAAQIMLYRPFLHHLLRAPNDPLFSIVGYGYGSACVQAAMQLVW